MKGIFTALVTPFKESGKVDYVALDRLLCYQQQSNVTGVVLFGSTGEEKLLTTTEKQTILRHAEKMLVTKKIYIGISEVTAARAIAEIKKLDCDCVSGFLVSAPYYVKPSQKALIEYFSDVATSTSKDICIYNIPSRTGVKIGQDTLETLSKFVNIVSTKDATQDKLFTKNICKRGKLFVLCGDDKEFLSMLKMGASGAVSVISNLYPNLFCKVFELYNNNQKRATKTLFKSFKKELDFLSNNGNPCGIKKMLADKHFLDNYTRKPILPL